MTAVTLVIILIIQCFYYAQIVRMNQNTAETYAENAASQAQGSIELIFQDVSQTAVDVGRSTLVQDLLTEEDPYEKYLLNRYVNTFVSTIINMQARIENILIYDTNGSLEYYYATVSGSSRPTLNQLGLEQILEYEPDGHIPSAQFWITEEAAAPLACSLPFLCTEFGPRHGKWLGYIVLLIPDTFGSILWEREEEGVYLLNQDRVPVFSEKTDSAALTAESQKSMVFTLEKPIGKTGWSVLFRMDMRETMKNYQFFQYSAILIGIILALLLISWGILIHARVVKPVIRLKNELETLDTAGLHARITHTYRGEIGEIASSFNRLLERLHELTQHIFRSQQEMYESELRQKETLLYALQTQVNPHFLFNTLQCIAGIAASKNVPEIVDASLAMSRIFQYSIRDRREQGGKRVTVREELDVVREYLKIINIRFMGQFQGFIDVDEEILDCPCLKMMLQPLVENALVHGLENTYGPGSIRVTGCKYHDTIYLKVADTGAGMSPEELERVRTLLADAMDSQMTEIRKGKIGLANIQHRIHMVFGPNYGIEILETGPKGTTIRLTIPWTANE